MIIDDDTLRKRRAELDFQLDVPELNEILSEINPPLNMLVFGLGNDSILWHECNEGGRTVFLEDLADWRTKITQVRPEIESYLVSYNTRVSDWRELIDAPEKLHIEDMPDEIRRAKWDIIFVDGPMGWKDDKPGRMKSIYEASRLIKPGGHIFVHDARREVESAYCDKYLLAQNFVREVAGASYLRHYWMR